jgi:hypothetical protein
MSGSKRIISMYNIFELNILPSLERSLTMDKEPFLFAAQNYIEITF